MTERKYKTNLNCGSCVAAVTPHLNGEGRIRRWAVDTRSPDKVLTVEGEAVGAETVERLVAAAGFRVLGEIDRPRDTDTDSTRPVPFQSAEKPVVTTVATPESRPNDSRSCCCSGSK